MLLELVWWLEIETVPFLAGSCKLFNFVRDPSTAEAFTGHHVAVLALDCRFSNIIIDGDALNVINLRLSIDINLAPFGDAIKDVKRLAN